MTNVIKFGGAAMADAKTILQCLEIIQSHNKNQIIVVSALYGLTEQLISGAQAACKQGSTELAYDIADNMSERHLQIFSELGFEIPSDFQTKISDIIQSYRDICHGLKILREFTPRCYDHVAAHGERSSALLLQALLELRSQPSVYIDATDMIRVQANSFGMSPLDTECKHLIRQHTEQPLQQGHKIVIPGFIAWDPEADMLVTLGEGGADYTASILAQSLNCAKVILYKDIPGLMTADPERVPEAIVIPHLHYREASELAYYGAAVLNPRTMVPVMKSMIPLIIKSFRHPEEPGTTIDHQTPSTPPPVQSLTAITQQTMIRIEGYGLAGVSGIATKAFQIFADAHIAVTFMSQASSENNICMTVDSTTAKAAVSLLHKVFAVEVQQGMIHRITTSEDVSVIAAVGLGMNGRVGVAAQCLEAVAQAGINVLGLAQGSSQLNISAVVADYDTNDALQAIHRSFGLSATQIQTSKTKPFSQYALKIHGFGHVGQAFTRRALSCKLPAYIATVSDSKGSVSLDTKHRASEIEALIQHKQHGHSLKDSDTIKPHDVLIDCTAAQTYDTIMQNLHEKKHIVLANKTPLSGTQAQWNTLMSTAKAKKLYLGYEATVGAGLPVIRTLQSILAGHDEVLSIYGSFSGSLGAIFSQMTEGSLFSEAVRHAYESGFTEPDFKEDLSAQDVQRKCLILARTLGIEIEPEDVHLEPVCHLPEESNQTKVLFELEEQNDEFKQRVESCHKRGLVLRYTASISKADGIHIGVEEVEKDSPCGLLNGSANIFIIETKFQSHPVIISGPGAGIQETASGLLSDLCSFFDGRYGRC